MTITTSLTSPPIPSSEQLDHANKNITLEKSYWNTFYSKFNISHPSQFCVMTAIEAESHRPIVEFGCGNGRDSIYFATHGYKVYACDLSRPAIEKNNEKAKKDVKDIDDRLDFMVVDASDHDDVGGIVKLARSSSGGDGAGNNVNVYTRFFLHSIDETQQSKFFSALSSAMIDGDKLYFEYRCSMDESLDKVHGKEHYRRYIDTPSMMEDMAKLGFEIVYEMTGRGMAKYKEEDPYVSRVIARKF
mmetsp:Transcript_8798/g.13934  ORF Transcript_8798/g.13934 Transcript_8798/m.13934 type:complete len:245 (-) Transcript_8798:342-1076(-)